MSEGEKPQDTGPEERGQPGQRRSTRSWRPAALELLRVRAFPTFILSTTAEELAFSLRSFGRSWLVLELTNSQLWVGLAGGIGAIPSILLSLVGGAVTDAGDRRRTIAMAWGIQAVLSFAIAYLITADLIRAWHLVAFSAVFAATMAFEGPALFSMVVDLVGERRTLSANALMSAVAWGGSVMAPAVAGYLTASYGVDVVYYVVVAALLVGVVAILRVRLPTEHQPTAREPMLASIRAGLAYARRTPPITALLIIVLTQLPGSFVLPLIPTYARDILGVGVTGFGTLTALHAAGFLTGFVLLSLGDIPKKGLVLVATGIMWDASMVAFGFSRAFPLSAALLFVMGVMGGIHMNTLTTLVQLSAEPHMRGRVLGLYRLVSAASPLGLIAGGALASAAGNEVALVIGMALSTPVLLLAYARSPALQRC